MHGPLASPTVKIVTYSDSGGFIPESAQRATRAAVGGSEEHHIIDPELSAREVDMTLSGAKRRRIDDVTIADRLEVCFLPISNTFS